MEEKKKGTDLWRIGSKAIVLLWAVWWIFFGLGTGIGEGNGLGGILLNAALPGLIFLATAYVAWYWEGLGSILLISEGALLLLLYLGSQLDPFNVLFMLSTVALPPLLAGVLLWMFRLKSNPVVNEAL